MTLGPNVGMGPVHFQRNKLRKCAERRTDDCEGCCSVVPCTYCLTLDLYGHNLAIGTATFSDGYWIGSVGGQSLLAYWEHNYTSGECEFVVRLNDAEVFRADCYVVSCRDASNSTDVTVGDDAGTLTWSKLEPRPLPYVIDEHGCRTWFCSDCECTCECLCATIIKLGATIDDFSGQCKGELCDLRYDDCGGPVWTGTINCGGEPHDLRITLARDEYTGGCLLLLNANGVDYDPVPVTGCQSLAASWQIDAYTTLEVVCKTCDCPVDLIGTPCCPDGIPATLFATYESVGGTCDNLAGVVVQLDNIGGAQTCWQGIEGVASCGGAPGTVTIAMVCQFDELGNPHWYLSDSSGGCTTLGAVVKGTLISCDPFEATFALGPGVGCCEPDAVNAQALIRVTE